MTWCKCVWTESGATHKGHQSPCVQFALVDTRWCGFGLINHVDCLVYGVRENAAWHSPEIVMPGGRSTALYVGR